MDEPSRSRDEQWGSVVQLVLISAAAEVLAISVIYVLSNLAELLC